MISKIVFVIILLSLLSIYPVTVNSLNSTHNIINNSSWTSIRDNLVVNLELIPNIPVIDEVTKLSFEVRDLNGSFLDNLNAKVTMTDHDGRLFKFENKSIPIYNGNFFVNYIFPDDGEHRIILQLYKNNTPFTVSSFDLTVPHKTPLPGENKLLNPITKFFDSILHIQTT